MVVYTQGTTTLGNKYPNLHLSSRSVTFFGAFKASKNDTLDYALMESSAWWMLHLCESSNLFLFELQQATSSILLMRMLLLYLVDSEELHKPFETCFGIIL